jgi:16S rRNA (cytidine1402-2'-O)-methyltransferase
MQKGKLYLIPAALAEYALHVIPAYIKEIIDATDFYIVENLKSARRFIRSVSREKNIDACVFMEMDKHSDYAFDDSFLNHLLEGKNIGLLSEAGVPCIADPGSQVVAAAHALEIAVVPLSGPSSIIMALMASGFNGQQFTFNGYLPIEATARKKKLLQMEASANKGHAEIFMDTPYRNAKLLEDIAHTLKVNTLLCIACNLTAKDEIVQTLPVSEWKKRKPDIQKKPAIFILGK